jgi:hypothetical protein
VVAQTSNKNFYGPTTTGNDSLVDVFPLAVGNQWTYEYYLYSYDEIASYHDSGTVTANIIDKIVTNDSIRWMIQEIDQIGFLSIDTIEVVELLKGNHQLYNTGDINKIITSEFPFLPCLDTMIYRYAIVDSAGVKTFRSRNTQGKGVFNFTFKKDIGLSLVTVSDGCTCLSGYSGENSLRSEIITGITDRQEGLRSLNFRLSQNFPNPFNPSTIISFNLSSRSFISLKVFDNIGREVATLVNEELSAGNHTRQWNAVNMPSGVYFYRLQSDKYSETKKLLLLK